MLTQNMEKIYKHEFYTQVHTILPLCYVDIMLYIPAWQAESGITHGEMTPQISSSPVWDSRVRVTVTPIHFILHVCSSLAGGVRNHTWRPDTTDCILSCLGQSCKGRRESHENDGSEDARVTITAACPR